MIKSPPPFSIKISVPLRSGGFTLTEMLAVISILAIILFAVMPELPGLLGSRGMTKALNEIKDMMELARNQAMTTSSYTYVCFENTVNDLGNDELQAFVLTAPGGKTFNTGDRRLLGLKLESAKHRWENLRMVEFEEVSDAIQKMRLTGNVSKSIIKQNKVDFAEGTTGPETSSYLAFAFSPQGHALFQPTQGSSEPGDFAQNIDINTPYERFIDIAIRPSRSGVLDEKNPDHAALILNGANGQIQILRH